MNTLRLIIKIKYLQLYGRHLARMLVSLKAARLPECPLPVCTAAEAFRSGSLHEDSHRWVWEAERTFAGCDGEWLYQTCLRARFTDISRASQPLTGAAGTGESPARMQSSYTRIKLLRSPDNVMCRQR